MRILLLSNMFAPEAYASAPLNTGACRFLVEAGHDVTVVTTFPHYPEWQIWPEYRGQIYRQENMDGIRVRRMWSYVPRKPKTVGRILHYAVFATVALPSCLGISRPDIILCVTPPIELGFTAWILKSFWKTPFVLWIKDLVPEIAIQLGMLRNRQAIALARQLERFAYEKATAIAVLCEGFKDYLVKQGVPPNKVTIVPDWVDTSLINPFIEGTAFRHAHNISSTDFLVLHSGNIGAKQGLETVVQAAHILSNQPGITFKIVGDGAAKPALMKKASHLNLPNLDFLPVQPKDKFPQVLAAADVLLVHQKGTAIESVIPSKLLTYMASARPIVAGVNPDSETAKAIMLARCGIRVDSEQPEHLAKAILSLRYDSQWRQEMGRNGRKFVEKHFSHALVLPRLEKLLKRVVASNS